jgi:hypothetical protein
MKPSAPPSELFIFCNPVLGGLDVAVAYEENTIDVMVSRRPVWTVVSDQSGNIAHPDELQSLGI